MGKAPSGQVFMGKAPYSGYFLFGHACFQGALCSAVNDEGVVDQVPWRRSLRKGGRAPAAAVPAGSFAFLYPMAMESSQAQLLELRLGFVNRLDGADRL